MNKTLSRMLENGRKSLPLFRDIYHHRRLQFSPREGGKLLCDLDPNGPYTDVLTEARARGFAAMT
jgi:hypothetical protein